MNKLISAIVLLASLLLQNATARGGDNPWKKIETRSDITLYERWVSAGTLVVVKERKGEMVIHSGIDKVIRTLSDPSSTRLWMENVRESYLIRKTADNEWYSYTCFSLPWPFDNRDLVCLSRLYRTNSREALIEMSSRDFIMPVKEKVTRLTNYKAAWKITDNGNGTVSISFTAVTYKAADYPRFIQDRVVRHAFMQSMENLKGLLAAN